MKLQKDLSPPPLWSRCPKRTYDLVLSLPWGVNSHAIYNTNSLYIHQDYRPIMHNGRGKFLRFGLCQLFIDLYFKGSDPPYKDCKVFFSNISSAILVQKSKDIIFINFYWTHFVRPPPLFWQNCAFIQRFYLCTAI